MNNILTISGQRGGSGKSTTALNLAVSLSLYEQRVLLVDCDPRGCATEWSGIGSSGYPFDLSSVLSGKAALMEAVSKTEFNFLDILPAGFNLFSAAQKLSRLTANEKILRLLLEDVRGDYDHIIVDAPSSYGFLSIAALTAADGLLISLCPRLNRTEDIHCLLKSIKYIRNTHGTPLKIAGVLFNRCLGEEEIRQFIEEQNLQETRELVCTAFIPEDDGVELAVRKRTPLALHDVKSPASQGYLSFAREMILAVNQR